MELPDVKSYEFETYQRRFRSPYNAPNVGEFNSKKVLTFIEPDPNLEQRFKKGVIYVSTAMRHQHKGHRHERHMGTKFDQRNDPSWHFKNKQAFRLATIASTGDETFEVASLDELNLTDKEGNVIGHEFLEEHLDILNGKQQIGCFSGVSSMHRRSQNQRSLTQLKGTIWKYHQKTFDNENEARDRRDILDKFDRTTMQVNFKFFKKIFNYLYY